MVYDTYNYPKDPYVCHMSMATFTINKKTQFC